MLIHSDKNIFGLADASVKKSMKRLGFRILNAFDPKKMKNANSKPVTESTTNIPHTHVSLGNLFSGISSRSHASVSSLATITSQSSASKMNNIVLMEETGMFYFAINKNK